MDKTTGNIFTHDEAAMIVDRFENLLYKHGIKLPSFEDDDREQDTDAALYGSTYSDLLDDIEETLIELLDRRASGEQVIKYEFSGNI